MGIGTSMGAYYDDAFHHAAAQWDSKYDDNVIDSDKFMTNKAVSSDPANIYDDSGNIVDYSDTLKLVAPIERELKSVDSDLQPLLQQQSIGQMPFPDNNNPDTNFVNRFGSLPPSGILNDLKKPIEKSLQRKL